jgi:hypothetical protein
MSVLLHLLATLAYDLFAWLKYIYLTGGAIVSSSKLTYHRYSS